MDGVCAYCNFKAKIFSSLLQQQVKKWEPDAQALLRVWWACYIGGPAGKDANEINEKE